MGKKKSTEDEGKSKFELALEKLDKAYGKGTVISLDSKVKGEYDTISTGSIGFDWITLGVGGFVKGRMYELMGWEGVGKSTICGHAVAECQKAGGKVLYIDGEHAVDKNYFKALGVDTTTLLIAQPSSGEEGFQIANDIINSGEIDLCVIDSDSSLIPKSAIVDGDIGDSTIGKKARLNSNAYPRIKNSLVQNKVCVLVISQYREKIGMMFGNPTTTQGGHALKFYSDCRIEITRTLAKEGDVTYGHITKVKSTKNKLASPYKSSSFDIVYGKGIDKIAEIIEIGVDLKVIEKSGTWYSFGETKLGQMSAMKELLNDNEELYDALKRAIINTIRESNPTIEEHESENV